MVQSQPRPNYTVTDAPIDAQVDVTSTQNKCFNDHF